MLLSKTQFKICQYYILLIIISNYCPLYGFHCFVNMVTIFSVVSNNFFFFSITKVNQEEEEKRLQNMKEIKQAGASYKDVDLAYYLNIMKISEPAGMSRHLNII